MTELNNTYWSNRYLNNDTGWDAGTITPPLKAYVDQLNDKSIAVLIPGCGNSYEAEYLLQHGFTNVTVIDISEVLCKQLSARLHAFIDKGLTVVCGDFFEHHGRYDLIIEQTFFCALSPGLRNDYVTKMSSLLKPGGKLVGVLFNKQFEGGPPFGGGVDEYQQLFSPHFDIVLMEPCYNSIPPRAGAEVFIKLVQPV